MHWASHHGPLGLEAMGWVVARTVEGNQCRRRSPAIDLVLNGQLVQCTEEGPPVSVPDVALEHLSQEAVEVQLSSTF